METGRVMGVLKGDGARRSLVKVHPDTGKPITRVILPDWQDAVKICLSTATALPGLRLQNWDLAICRTGPLLIEVNFRGAVDLPQYAYRTGLLDTELRHYLGL
jgi:hypothetical protein